MLESTRSSIRHIFLNPRPCFALMTAAGLLGISFQELTREIAEGEIVAVSTGMGVRVPRAEMMAAAMRTRAQEVIEEALGEDAARVLPEAIRLCELRARVPRYHVEMLKHFARCGRTSLDRVLARELEDVACAHAEELARAVPGFAAALAWPEVG